MKLSNYPLRTLKDAPSDAELISHQLMLRSGLIKKLASGIFTWMPFGLKVLRKIEQTVRNEMDESGALEVLMPTIQPSELWQETQRWDDYGNLLLQIHDRHDRLVCYGPTHEEVITDILRKSIKSYKQLPANFYQIFQKAGGGWGCSQIFLQRFAPDFFFQGSTLCFFDKKLSFFR